MAGRGFQQIGDLSDAKELRKLNDQLYLLWYKVLGRIEGKDVDPEKFNLKLDFAEGGTLTVGGDTGGVIQIRNSSGGLIGELGENGVWINADRLAVKNEASYGYYLIGERNFCEDHSFENVAHDTLEDATHHDFAMTAPAAGLDRWEIDGGTPRVLDDAACSVTSQRYAWFGNQSVACNSDNRVSYTTRVDAARTEYTVSVHAWPHYSRNGAASVRVNMEVIWLDENQALVKTESLFSHALTSNFSPGTNGRIYAGVRISSSYIRPDTARYVKVRLFSPAAAEWVCYDGVQIAAADRMLMYLP